MTNYNGFVVNHTQEIVTVEKSLISTNCMQVDIENTGERTATLCIKDSNVKYKLGSGESVTFPFFQSNPLILLGDSFRVDFEAGTSIKELIVTKAYASTKVISL